MEAFVRSVELGGFSAAARELKLSPSALSKLVSRLESALKVRLLTRTTRRLAPTPEGELFLARCRRGLAELEDAEEEVGRPPARPPGRPGPPPGAAAWQAAAARRRGCRDTPPRARVAALSQALPRNRD